MTCAIINIGASLTMLGRWYTSVGGSYEWINESKDIRSLSYDIVKAEVDNNAQ